MVDVNNSHSIPLFDPITHLVFGAGRSDITDVFVSGKHIVKNKQITGIDIEKIYDEVREFCLLYTSPSPRDRSLSRMPSSA